MLRRLKKRRGWRLFKKEKKFHFSGLLKSVSKRNKSTGSSCTSFCCFTFLLLLRAQEMSAKSRSQGRTFWLESHQVASSPVCLSPSLSLGKATLRLGLKHPRTFEVKTQTQHSDCSGSRVLWERRKSSAEAHHPENRFHQLLCVSCTKDLVSCTKDAEGKLRQMLPYGVLPRVGSSQTSAVHPAEISRIVEN